MNSSLFMGGHWRSGGGDIFESRNPYDGELLWQGTAASIIDVDEAMQHARAAFPSWRAVSIEKRFSYIEAFKERLKQEQEALAALIARETGKPLWESKTEVAAMIGKVDISKSAYEDRSGHQEADVPAGHALLKHRPHGVVAVLGPFNFPGHLPNGHIVPALLAGNTVLFKPSEQTPATAEFMVKCWQSTGLPDGVLSLVQGEKDTGIALVNHPDLDGLFFTGSSSTGQNLHRLFAGQTGKILALEMGGNNPLIIDTDYGDIDAAVHHTIQSAFITAGQRCTCARRLLVPDGPSGQGFLDRLCKVTQGIRVGAWDDDPQAFMGTVIDENSARHLLASQQSLVDQGGRPLIQMKQPIDSVPALLSPGVIDVTDIPELPDEEMFGPLLQVIRYEHFAQAITLANQTRYGLSAGLISTNKERFDQFYEQARAGIINWNKPLTGASSGAPFGGVGASGNHRPSAYYAADYCAYPVASLVADAAALPGALSPGLPDSLNLDK